jgi:hypothetical protein
MALYTFPYIPDKIEVKRVAGKTSGFQFLGPLRDTFNLPKSQDCYVKYSHDPQNYYFILFEFFETKVSNSRLLNTRPVLYSNITKTDYSSTVLQNFPYELHIVDYRKGLIYIAPPFNLHITYDECTTNLLDSLNTLCDINDSGIYRYVKNVDNGGSIYRDVIYIGRGRFRDRFAESIRDSWDYTYIEFCVYNNEYLEKYWEFTLVEKFKADNQGKKPVNNLINIPAYTIDNLRNDLGL